MHPADLLPPETAAEEDPLLDSAAQLEQVARALDLENWIVQRLHHPEREITVHLPLRRDSGDTALYTACRVQHFRARAGSLGPVLLGPDAYLAQLRPLAAHLTLQCALLDLPLGGSAGAIVCHPAQLSERELRHLVRSYLSTLDVAGDIYAPAECPAAWTGRRLDPTVVVGKPAAGGGLPDVAGAVAAGWLTLLSDVLTVRPRSGAALASPGSLDGCRVSVQGFGPAAVALAHMLDQAGARIVALADKSGGLFADRGLNPAEVAGHVARHGLLFGFPGAEPVQNADVLESACDVLVLADGERQLNLQNVSRIRAPLMLETVFHAITPAAARALAARGATVVPALLAAAPLTLAWFAEWQHTLRAVPQQESVETEIQRKLSAGVHAVRSAARSHDGSLADTCVALALQKFAAVLRLAG